MKQLFNTAAGSLLLVMLAACNGTSDEPPATPAAEAPETAAESKPAGMPRSTAAESARVYFITPQDGDVVSSPVRVEFGIEEMEVVPAGTQARNSGHHHVLVDTGLPPMDAPIPADSQHVHFGDGSTETELDLGPGEHTLQLLFADHLHIPHKPPVYSERITITVE
ncbi:MAG: DUF4399 domain-containing protein [Woeseia sp.]